MTMNTVTEFWGETDSETTTDSGTYTTNGDVVTLTSIDGESEQMNYSFDGDHLILETDSEKITYTKQ